MIYSAINCFFIYICMYIEIFIQKIYFFVYDQMILSSIIQCLVIIGKLTNHN